LETTTPCPTSTPISLPRLVTQTDARENQFGFLPQATHHHSIDTPCLSPGSPTSSESSPRRSRAGRHSKLPINALNRLQAWLDANQEHPYPNSETKRLLAQECGITEKQVNTWFTNARARQLNAADSGNDADAANDSDDDTSPQMISGPFSYPYRGMHGDVTQRKTSVASQTRTRASRRGKKKDYRRNTIQEQPQTPLLTSPNPFTSPIDQSLPADQEMWQCTFCRKALVPKSWRRHEDTQHRPKTQAARWTCMLHGPRLNYPNRSASATGTSSVCAFCMMKNPSEDHFLQHHRIEDCAKRDIGDRTFYRPDHLRQHIKNFHNATLYDIVQARWKKAAETVTEGWTCGFCGDRLDTWDKRETHIANHFKDGMTMASWREHPEIEKRVSRKRMADEMMDNTGCAPHTAIGIPFFQPELSAHQNQTHGQTEAFGSTVQTLPIASPSHVHGDGFNGIGRPSMAYTSSSTSMDLDISQASLLSNTPAFDPLTMNAYSNYFDWASVPTTLEHQMQYSVPNTNIYDQSLATTPLQQGFDNTLDLQLYSNPVDYMKTWNELRQQNQHQQQQQQR